MLVKTLGKAQHFLIQVVTDLVYRGIRAMLVTRIILLTTVAFSSLLLSPGVGAQVFVVGEKTATADLPTDFTPTDYVLPAGKLNDRERRELVRDLDTEQGFAHRALPLGAGLVLKANGPLEESAEQYRKMIFSKGEACAPGDRVVITALLVKADRIVVDLNGGPYEKHRFLKHIQLNDNDVVQGNNQPVTGSRVTLVFPGGIPEVTAPEVKALLEPLIDFGVKTGVQAYADTLPAPLKRAIAQHDVLVGMDHRMVLAALGTPESKVREHAGEGGEGRYEEWIYGQVPKTVKFVRFRGDRVTQVKIAAMGKPIEVRDKDEMAAFRPEEPGHVVLLGDARVAEDAARKAPPPTLRQAGDAPAAVPGGLNRVQFPDAKPKSAGQAAPPADATPATHFTASTGTPGPSPARVN